MNHADRRSESTRRARSRWCGAFALGALGLQAPLALADDSAPTPARALFNEGRNLVNQGNYVGACPKFEKSLQLEVGVGTQFNLADCWEHIGRVASAQQLFLGAAATAKAAGQTDREQVLRDRAAALEPRISKLVIDVNDDSPRLVIKRDQLPIESENWGKALALDPGSYELTAKAPGKKTWHKTFEITAGTPIVTVEVPVLGRIEEEEAAPAPPRHEPAVPRRAAAAPPASALATDDRPSSTGVNVKALALGGLGVGALTFATIVGLRYTSANDDAKAICPTNVGCTDRQIADHSHAVDRAVRDRAWMYAGGGVGVASLTAAAVFYFTAGSPRAKAASLRATPTLGLHGELGASVAGAF